MAGLKKLSTRIINKHATAAVWNATNFTPLQGEIVIYDPGYDSKDGKTYSRERMKIGDGSHTVQELPFAHEVEVSVTENAESVTVVTSVGSPTYIAAEYTAPSLTQQYDQELLKINFDAGAYKPAEFNAGAMPTTRTIEYLTDVAISTATPVD